MNKYDWMLMVSIIFVLLSFCVNATDYCYQETANVSTSCGGLSFGSYSYDAADTVYMEYMKPEFATNESLWQLRQGDAGTVNYTIPSTCWNYHKLSFKINSSSYPSPMNSNSYCYNGSDWVLILSESISYATANCTTNDDPPTKFYDGDWGTYDIYVNGEDVWCSSETSAWKLEARIYEEAMWWAGKQSVTTITDLGTNYTFNATLVNYTFYKNNGTISSSEGDADQINYSTNYPVTATEADYGTVWWNKYTIQETDGINRTEFTQAISINNTFDNTSLIPAVLYNSTQDIICSNKYLAEELDVDECMINLSNNNGLLIIPFNITANTDYIVYVAWGKQTNFEDNITVIKEINDLESDMYITAIKYDTTDENYIESESPWLYNFTETSDWEYFGFDDSAWTNSSSIIMYAPAISGSQTSCSDDCNDHCTASCTVYSNCPSSLGSKSCQTYSSGSRCADSCSETGYYPSCSAFSKCTMNAFYYNWDSGNDQIYLRRNFDFHLDNDWITGLSFDLNIADGVECFYNGAKILDNLTRAGGATRYIVDTTIDDFQETTRRAFNNGNNVVACTAKVNDGTDRYFDTNFNITYYTAALAPYLNVSGVNRWNVSGYFTEINETNVSDYLSYGSNTLNFGKEGGGSAGIIYFGPGNTTTMNLTNYNLTSANSLYDGNWDLDPKTRAYTLDTTPTITFDTNENAICRIGITDSNFTTMNESRNCSTTGESSHICTLTAQDTLSLNDNNLYVSCGNYTYIIEGSTSDSTALPIGIKTVPSEPQLDYPSNNSNVHYNSSVTTVTLNWSRSTDTDNDSLYYYVYVDDVLKTTIVPGDTWCYQESANISNQTGIDGSCSLNYDGIVEYEPDVSFPEVNSWNHAFQGSKTIDGSWNPYSCGAVRTGQIGVVNLTYMKPTNSNNAIWQTKYGYSSQITINNSIPDICWDAYSDKLKLQFKHIYSPLSVVINCYNGTDYQEVFSTTSNADCFYEEAIYWNVSSGNSYEYTMPVPSTTGTTINWTVIAGDTLYNSTNQYFYFTAQPESYLYLNGLPINRTYEYYSVADLKVNTSGTGEICLSIYDINHGVNFQCETNETSYNYTIANYTATTSFTSGSENGSLYFRENSSENLNLGLPTYLDVVSATVDLTGYYSPESITKFNDWNSSQTSKLYNWSNTTTLYMTIRDSNEFKSATFDIISTDGAEDLAIDICNDGTIDVNETGFFIGPTQITIDDIDDLNDCINTSEDFNIIPFNFTFTTYENFTISDMQFKRTELFKPRNVYMDAGNDSLIDNVFMGTISGTYGVVDTFTDGDSTQDITSTVEAGTSELVYVNIPADASVTDFSIIIRASSTDNVFEDNFYNLDYVNQTTTTAVTNTHFGQVRNREDSQNRPLESFIYSKSIPTVNPSVDSITWTATDVEPDDSSYIIYYFSSDNGANWTTITSNGAYTILYPGNQSLWYADMKSNLVNSTYITKIKIEGLDSNPYNISIDVGNTGTADYNDEGEQSAELREIDVPHAQFNTERASQTSTTGLIEVPINITFEGKGTIHITGIEVTYSLDDVTINSNAVTAFINNIKTTLTTISSFLTGTAYDSTDNATFNITSNGIISSSRIELVGDHDE